MARSHRTLIYRVTQMLTRYGSFRVYLHEIHKVQTSTYIYCRAVVDTGLHTMLHCPVWTEQKRKILRMIRRIGIRRNYEVVGAIVLKETGRACAEYCETVMRRKAEGKRERQRRATMAGVETPLPSIPNYKIYR